MIQMNKAEAGKVFSAISSEEKSVRNPYEPVPEAELSARLARLRAALYAADPAWEMLFLEEKIDLFYFTGTMQDGALIVTPDEAVFFIRRDMVCAERESRFPDIRPMKSFRQLAEAFPKPPKKLYIHEEKLTVSRLSMLRSRFAFGETAAADTILSKLRSEKSAYEIDCMRTAGRIHEAVLDQLAAKYIRKGISEAELCIALCREMIMRGAMGSSRFNQALGEDILGVCSFGENGLLSLGLDSPTGEAGCSIAMKSIGSAVRFLQEGELILLDIPSSFLGYHTDKSKNYYLTRQTAEKGRAVPEIVKAAHDNCVLIEKEAAKLLVPGAVPSEIYEKIQHYVDPCFCSGFMNGVHFLGHSIGLTMDEKPVIAAHFDEPLQKNMTIALEPKIALPGYGLAGTENTYFVCDPRGAESLTGDADADWVL